MNRISLFVPNDFEVFDRFKLNFRSYHLKLFITFILIYFKTFSGEEDNGERSDDDDFEEDIEEESADSDDSDIVEVKNRPASPELPDVSHLKFWLNIRPIFISAVLYNFSMLNVFYHN